MIESSRTHRRVAERIGEGTRASPVQDFALIRKTLEERAVEFAEVAGSALAEQGVTPVQPWKLARTRDVLVFC